MKLSSISAIALGLLTLSGCFGYAPGALHGGQQATVRFSLTDASGHVVAAACLAGPPFGGMPAEVAQAIIGHRVGDELQVGVSGPLVCYPIAAVTAELGSEPRFTDYPRSVWESRFGPATVGQLVQLPGPSGAYPVDIVAVNGTMVTYEGHDFQDRTAFPDKGVDLLAARNATSIHYTVAANVTWAVFPGPLKPLATTSGNFTVVGQEGDRILVASDAGHVVATGSLVAHVTLLQGWPASAPTAQGEYGRRNSPVLAPLATD